MTALSPHVRAQALRVLRLAAFALATQPVVAALVSSTLIRYPLVAALVAAAEAVVRQLYPVKPLRAAAVPDAPVPSQGQAGSERPST